MRLAAAAPAALMLLDILGRSALGSGLELEHTPLMKMAMTLAALIALSLVRLPAADAPNGAQLKGTTNVFSNWTGKSTNLSVRATSAPWEASKSRLLGVTKGRKPAIIIDEIAKKREVERSREKVLGAPAYSETFRVSLPAPSLKPATEEAK